MIFSVIVPVCNGEAFIEECVRSAAEQAEDFEDPKEVFEVIICENGSTDATPGICDELARRYENVTTIHRGKTGLFRARQEGIRIAKGEWIVSLDGDDEMAPGALKTLFDTIEQGKRAGDEPDLILYNAAVLGKEDKPLRNYPFTAGRMYRGSDMDVFKEQLCTDDSVNAMWTKCVRREIAAFDHIDLFLNYGEDLYQTAQHLDRAKGILYLDRILYYYRRDAVSLSSSYSEIYLEDEKKTWQQLDEYSKKWFGDRFTETISQRKALTCTIAATKLIYSNLSQRDKGYKLDKLMNDSFYREYAGKPLPKWAPEEAVYVNALQTRTDCRQALLSDGFKRSFKNRIKGLLRNGR